ncbi:MAG: hypothetical protein ACP5M4_08315 [Acidobacteriaceae bacterium]
MPSAFSFRRNAAISASILAASLCLFLTGCVVKVDKNGHGSQKKDNVSVVTPFGGVHVQSNQTNAADLGLSVYPGAVETTDNGNDKSANVNLGFGPWQMKVKVVTYKTTDPRDKVVAYYRKALSQFGTVIACNGDSPDGTPTTTDQGLTCKESGKQVNINTDTSDSGFNLRAGSPHHQRIVAFKDNGGQGTKFTLVELVLPTDHGKNNTPD